MQPSEATLVWADRVLLASSVLYLYDFFLTISKECEHMWGELWRLERPRRRVFFIARCLPFVAVRYTALMYYSYIIYALAAWTTSHCDILSSRAQTLESIFLFTWTGAIWSRLWRLWTMYPYTILRWVWICTLLPLGLAAPIYGVAVASPSLFPRCRVTTHTSHAALMMPTLRVAFDGLAAVVYTAGMTWKMFESRRLLKDYGETQVVTILTHLSVEGIQDILLIISLLVVEIVFLLIPSANSHGRNFVAPFVDSFSSILAVRGPLELMKMVQNERARLEETTIGSQSEVTLVQLNN